MCQDSWANKDSYHFPVMLSQIIEYLNIRLGENYADATMGSGGHSMAILAEMNGQGQMFCFDRDPDAISHSALKLEAKGAKVIQARFSEMKKYIPPNSLSGIIYDLGVSSHQLDMRSRGFSFADPQEKVDMRMNTDSEFSARDYLEQVSERDLSFAFSKNSDLQRSRKLASLVKQGLKEIEGELTASFFKDIISKVYPDKARQHVSLQARVFQAIRMEVNEELWEIKQSMTDLIDLLKIGGRVCVLSYHSVEDRAVKHTMREFEKECICPVEFPVCMCGGKYKKIKKVLRKPMLPSEEEIKVNSRARSAKLRVYERV